MAVLKLKLKVNGDESSSATPAPAAAPRVPKIKLNPPKMKNLKVEKPDKIKKLKINIGGSKKASLDNLNVEGITQQVRRVPKVRVKPTRVPGDGYDSETPDNEDDPLLENGIVIRFLDDINLDIVHNAVESNDLNGINVKWLTKDKALVNLRGNIYSARLVDLPTVNEVFKTIDKKNIFKVLDLCQMLLVLKSVSPSELNLESDFEVPTEKTYRHPFYDLKPKELKESRPVLTDGLVAPFSNVYRRFRPKKLNHRVMDDIESKVNELIQLDNNAEESHFEILDATRANATATTRFSPSPPPMMAQSQSQAQASQVSEISEGIIPQDDMGEFGDMAVSDEDLEEELAKALETNVGILNEEGEEMIIEGETPGMEEDEEDDDDEDEDDDDDDDDDDEDDDDDDRDQQTGGHHVKMLEEEILDLEKVVAAQKKGFDNATQRMMKMKFQSTYNTLKANLDNKKRELSRLLGEDEEEEGPQVDGEEGDAGEEGEEEGEEGEEKEDEEEDADDLDDLF